MKKQILALALAGIMALSMAACGGDSGGEGSTTSGGTDSRASGTSAAAGEKSIKVGMICIGDENDQGYTYNMIRGQKEATEALKKEGINVDWVVKYNIGEDATCEDANTELADSDCKLIFNTSFGFEDYMLKVAPDYPDIQFVACTNQASAKSELTNVHNAFANIYEGRYLAGVAGGMKLKQMIDEKKITADQAVIGYVGAYPYSEVISGFTAFYLGAKSVCPSVTMKVKYVNSWSNATEEANAATALADEGCKLISQHSDNTTPATAAQSAGVFQCGYNNDMSGVAPQASLISCRIDWAPYFEYAIKSVVDGKSFDKDWTAGMKEGAVVMTPLNEKIAAPGTADKLKEVQKGIEDGTIHPFEGPWTGKGKAFGADKEDTKTMPEGQWYKESDVADGQPSAPQFYWILDGIKPE